MHKLRFIFRVIFDILCHISYTLKEIEKYTHTHRQIHIGIKAQTRLRALYIRIYKYVDIITVFGIMIFLTLMAKIFMITLDYNI